MADSGLKHFESLISWLEQHNHHNVLLCLVIYLDLVVWKEAWECSIRNFVEQVLHVSFSPGAMVVLCYDLLAYVTRLVCHCLKFMLIMRTHRLWTFFNLCRCRKSIKIEGIVIASSYNCFPVFTVRQFGVNCGAWAVFLPYSIPTLICSPFPWPTCPLASAGVTSPSGAAMHEFWSLVQRVGTAQTSVCTVNFF